MSRWRPGGCAAETRAAPARASGLANQRCRPSRLENDVPFRRDAAHLALHLLVGGALAEALSRLVLEAVEGGEVFLQRFRHHQDPRLGIAELDQTAVLEPVDDGPCEEFDACGGGGGHDSCD